MAKRISQIILIALNILLISIFFNLISHPYGGLALSTFSGLFLIGGCLIAIAHPHLKIALLLQFICVCVGLLFGICSFEYYKYHSSEIQMKILSLESFGTFLMVSIVALISGSIGVVLTLGAYKLFQRNKLRSSIS